MTDTTLKLTEAFNRHNTLYNALLGNLTTLTTAHNEEVTITLDAGKVRSLTRILNAAPMDGDPKCTRVNVETDTDAEETDPVSALHEAYIAAFPCVPEVDVSFTSESQTRINPKGAVETETFVTIHVTTTEAGAWYMKEILNRLYEENR